jgi:nicotinate-nucleotide pyrophosphorylase (carboxylating)
LNNDLNKKILKDLIQLSIREDRVHQDITSSLSYPKNRIIKANIIVKEKAILFGCALICTILKKIDSKLKIKLFKKDKQKVNKGNKIISIQGPVKSILKSERLILNFLGHLSGVATQTYLLVEKVKKYKTKICCTRKTIPGLRILQKIAVKAGGGVNNRFDLEDEIFVKDNHHFDKLSFRSKIQSIIRKNKKRKMITVEVDSLSQLKSILDLKINRILLDNFSPPSLKKVIALIPNKIETEASGNINPNNILAYAKTGVQRISLGYLTHSVKNIDFSLTF